MSFQALSSALSGLKIAQQQLNVISNNVSNASTPGYTRKILPQSTEVINSTGEVYGVKGDTMIRNVDLNLESQLWTQVSSIAATGAKQTYLDTIEKFHGTTNTESSIAAQISKLKDNFSSLSDSPSDGFLLQSTLQQATNVASKLNDFGQLITQQRNDAQDDMSKTVGRVNSLLGSIASLNNQIKGAANLSRSTASLEDTRDQNINELSGLMGITYFSRGDGVLVVQTSQGVQLADEKATEVYFKPTQLGVSSTYPGSTAGIYVGGDPTTNKQSVDITPSNVGGKIGGLIDIRDNIMPQYQAQADELAEKLATHLDAQGLRLFTDQSGTVPSDAPPDLTTNPPKAVAYVGFASIIQVNQAVANNIKLIQQGTYKSDATVPSGSNEVIRRVIQFGFGNIDHQEINGTTNLNVTAPATDLQSLLGITSANKVTGGINLSSFSQIDDGLPSSGDLTDSLQSYLPNYPNKDSFNITFGDTRLGLGPTTINIDLSDASTNHPLGGSIKNALDQIVAEVNSQIAAAPVAAGLAASASVNSSGQLVINTRGDVTLDATSGGNAMGASAFGALGLKEGTFKTEDPYFDVQVGTGTVKRISIAPGDTVTNLVTKLRYNPATGAGVPGLDVTYDSVAGTLSLRPGMDNSNGGPAFGGDMKIISGPGQTTGPVNAALAALPSSVGLVSALFGSYSVSGGTVLETSPVNNAAYQSETAKGSGVFVAYRQDNLGAGANIKAGILSGDSIADYGQKMINSQAQDIIVNKSQSDDATALHDMLQGRLLSESGVNVDEELSNMIVIQTAYSAAARVVSAAGSMFDELLAVFR